MTKDYPLNGTKIIMRRLFKYNADEICECFNEYNTLFFNPVNAEFISNIFLHGEFWGAFICDKLICCCYIYPFDCSFSKKEAKYDLICDFTDTPSEYLCMGYVGTNTDYFDKWSIKELSPYFEAELDYEKGVLVWEVDFDYQNFDYSYDINANTGAVILEEIKKDDK